MVLNCYLDVKFIKVELNSAIIVDVQEHRLDFNTLWWNPSSKDGLVSNSEGMVCSPLYTSISLVRDFLSPEVLQMATCFLEESLNYTEPNHEQCWVGCKFGMICDIRDWRSEQGEIVFVCRVILRP